MIINNRINNLYEKEKKYGYTLIEFKISRCQFQNEAKINIQVVLCLMSKSLSCF